MRVEIRDLEVARQRMPAVWQAVRRYDKPTQAALFAAHQVLENIEDPANTALVAIAPRQAGSPELLEWVHRIDAMQRAGSREPIRMNPVHTLHAVDNLALSHLSMSIGARGYGLCLGGAEGQVEAGRVLLQERLSKGPETHGILFGCNSNGDGFAESVHRPAAGLGAWTSSSAFPPHRVVITGLGAVSAFGLGVDALWSNLLAHRSALRTLPEAAALALPVTAGGAVPFTGPDRDLRIAQAALSEARKQAHLPEGPLDAGFYWGCALDTFQAGPEGLVHRPASQCFQALAADYLNHHLMLAVACASGTRSVGEAFQAIRRGDLDLAVAGCSAVMLTPFYLIGFGALRAVALDEDAPDPAMSCRPFDATRAGFTLADGAGALILESLEHAQSRGAPILAEVLGLGTSMDAHDLNRPPEDGRGARACMENCLQDAGLPLSAVDAINAHGTGTRVGDVAEAHAIRDLFGRIPVHGIKGAIGHAMAAAGALEAIVAVQGIRHHCLPPTVGLCTPDERCGLDHVIGAPRGLGHAPRILSASYGMGGQNAAILLGSFRP